MKNVILSVTSTCDSQHKKACRIRVGSTSRTLVSWKPVFDADANIINSDPNTTTYELSCLECNKNWTVKESGSSIKEVSLWEPKNIEFKASTNWYDT